MEKVRILFIEEDAQDYLKSRQLLDEQQINQLTIDWAPNYEIALKRIKQNSYDVYLIGYHASFAQQQFLSGLYETVAIPTIFLLKPNKAIDSRWLENYHTDVIRKDQFSWLILERTIHSLSRLLALQRKEKSFQTLFEQAFYPLGIIHPNGIWSEVNQAALKLVNMKREAVVGFPLWKAPSANSQSQLLLKTAISTAQEGKTSRCEVEIQKYNGQAITLDLAFTPVTNEDTIVIAILVEGRDLSERRVLEQQLTHTNLHDQLTGLPNKYLFLEQLDQAMIRARQQPNYYFAVLILDLDRFRLINTSLGHDMGDWLLMEVAQRLQDFLKSYQCFLARPGGDEFMILVDNMQELNEATHLAIAINEILAFPIALDGYHIVTSASIGIAYYTDQQENTELLREADVAMYRAKTMGKSCHVVFSRAMHQQAVSRLQLEMDLYQAVEKKKFVLFYQPQMELNSEQLIGTESLVRFYHPQNGHISPIDFKTVLEDTGIITTIVEWMLQTACRQLKIWWESGLTINRTAINLSAQQFRNKRLIQIVANSLENNGLDPSCLEFELTENLLLGDTELAIKTLKVFKNMGIRVTIDEFGTGYASLSYLKRFPADGLKIDKSFIKDIITSPEDAAITVATIDMAHALGLAVTAEGVETIEQRDFLRDHGCDFAQGYLYAPPMEDTTFLEWGKQYNKMITNTKLLPK
jgi:diguanylate cyclase (GGDEF)-like protein/PAS domain S-box-containing protein